MLDPQGRAFRVLLGAQSMVSSLAVDMSLPALPALGQDFGAPADRVQLTIGAYLIGYAAGQLFYGPLSDRFGRRPMLLLGMAIYTLSAVLCPLAPTIEAVVALRLLQGFGGCVGVVVTRAAARDYFSGTNLAQMLSSLSAIQAFGPLVAPVLGGALASHLGWRSIFLAQGGFAALVLLAVWTGFAESLPRRDPHAIRPRQLLANYATFFANPRCIGFTLVATCVFSGLFAVLSASPFVLIDLSTASRARPMASSSAPRCWASWRARSGTGGCCAPGCAAMRSCSAASPCCSPRPRRCSSAPRCAGAAPPGS